MSTIKEEYKDIIGNFKIETIKDGVVIDTLEQKNLIMDKARSTFAKLIAGVPTPPINKLVLGNQGHITGDYLVPKTSEEGFVATRTKLFSQDTGILGTDYITHTWTPTGVSGDTVTTSDGKATVTTTVSGNETTYVYEIPENSSNGTGTIVFTECAMYTSDDIFSMRTFRGKIKSGDVGMRITWKIMF